MTLLWITLACLAGVWAGELLLGAARAPDAYFLQGLACGLPAWLWLLPAVLLPLAPQLNALARPARGVVRQWPAAAGFRMPLQQPTPALAAGFLLALLVGLLLGLGTPAEPCWDATNLASSNVPAEQAFDRDQPAVAVYGTLSRFVPDATGRVRLFVEANALDDGAGLRPVTGGLTLLADGPQITADGLQYGDAVRVWGTPSTPPTFSDFSYRDYLARHGIHSQMALGTIEAAEGTPGGNRLLQTLYPIRKAGERLLNRALPEPYAALANGMLLGIDANIPDDTQAAFNDTSASHVLVISGSNVALLSGLIFALGRRLWSRRTAAGVTLAAIALYTLLVGGEPSVVRAAVMGALVVVAVALGRRSTALVSLAVAALAMVLLNPHVLFDVGFQLSAAATAGLVLLTPLLPGGRTLDPARVAGEGLASPLAPVWATLRDALVVTLAASLAVQPLLLYHFQRLSLVGLLTNVLIVPVQPLVLTLGTAGLSLGLLAGLVGASLIALPLLWGAWLGLAWTLLVVETTAQWRWASLAIGGFGGAAMIATYALLGLLVWQQQRRSGNTGGGRLLHMATAPATTGVLTLACALVWVGVWSLPDGRLHLHALEADRGSALVITLPSGGQVLVDGGGDTARMLTMLGGVLPLWDRTLELMVLSVDDKATAEAQAALPMRHLVHSALNTSGDGEAGDLWARGLEAAHVPQFALAVGGWAELGDGVTLWALPSAPGEPMATKLVSGDFSLLIPGSAKAPDVAAALANPSLYAATVLLAPDIRTGDEVAAAWMAVAKPEMVISWEDATLTPPDGLTPLIHTPAASGSLAITSDGTTWSHQVRR